VCPVTGNGDSRQIAEKNARAAQNKQTNFFNSMMLFGKFDLKHWF
jgi:hypothetical protein